LRQSQYKKGCKVTNKNRPEGCPGRFLFEWVAVSCGFIQPPV